MFFVQTSKWLQAYTQKLPNMKKSCMQNTELLTKTPVE